MLISFEGIDGSGKTTQIALLKQKIEETGRSVQVFREPGGTDLSEKIRSILLDSDMDIHPVSEVLLFSAARSQLIAQNVQPLLKQGYTVILDRFYDSTIAYQGYGRACMPIEQLHQINRIASHGLTPDLTFYLRISHEQSKERLAGQPADRMERSGDAFYERVIKGFDDLAQQEPRFLQIDAKQQVDYIHQIIWEQTLKLLHQ